MRLYGDLGSCFLRLHLRPSEWRAQRLNLRISLVLGRLGVCRRHHGRVGEYVADCGRAVPLDLHTCARWLEDAAELFGWMVRTNPA
jgi:hypothetical protein